MITFKEFIAEGFLSEFREKLGAMKKEIAADIGERTYRVQVDRRVSGNGENGFYVSFAVPIAPDHMDAQDFFEKMVTRTVKKALEKHFDRHHLATCDNISWDNGRAIYIQAQVPDADGLM
jgi:hypothetical protein